MGGNLILDPIFSGKDKWITNLEVNACSDHHTLTIFVKKKSKNCMHAFVYKGFTKPQNILN